MSKGTVLVAGSNANRIEIRGGGTGPTGQYLNELVVPVMALVDAGYDIVFATPNGSKPHIDPASDKAVHFDDEAAYRQARAFFDTSPVLNKVSTLRALIETGLDRYDGFFTPGGQAPVVDLMQDGDLGEILRFFHVQARPTAFLCHGPIASVAALPRAKEFRAALIAGETVRAAALGNGWQYAGYKMTVYSRSEEKPIEEQILHGKLYFDMPSALTIAGAQVNTGPDFAPHVVEDREMITGQNPRSDHPLARALIAALDRRRIKPNASHTASAEKVSP
ncbi:type 1 glutamine amidotransferase domain-containing protein [Bradyrhizobium sp. INPA01-394B]|uniref:Type 1 glutamine amidotransferase domain-containing protein n=1 Tax=Bradyrhizobium campsiandrae TaxID=1729892 RepID=A0ABR7UKV0_9BRAD|nr:type 1 glutamine amidotransferase domain-containing protein [Bradyrhizobium campsiandrae]MBC9881826.1 type 1 glutamine amidotransferase domain-containing protein [Bradyrhizobium campsiandrae]MBC9984226.1 type 1 glutamine amidotransferase domain-containing protein [Bradyrhizobium campsiandrae]